MFTNTKPERPTLPKLLVVAAFTLAALVVQTLWLEHVVSGPVVSALIATEPTGRPHFYEDLEVRPPSREHLVATADETASPNAE